MVSSSEPVIESSSKTQKWSRAQFDVNIPLEESCLLTLISADDDGNLVVLGNGFIISNQGPYAICISAAHCFEEAKKHQWAATVTPCPTLPDVFKSKATEYIRPDGIAAAYLTPKGPICCRICDINYIANYDGSLFTIRVPPESGHVFEAHIELDLGMPAVGDEVGVMAHRLEIEQRAPGEAELRRKIEFCFGTVTAVQTEQRRMGQMCWFETTIPFHPGMSGAPLVRAPRPGIVVAACGIVSSDFSSEAAMNSFSEPGRGTAAMIWPAMALGLKVRRSDQPAAFAYLSELVDQGIIRNQNSEVSVVVRRGPNQIELHYTDRHPTSAKKIVLQTAAHPLASSL
jgi:Trypsin-like peptidase domain